MIAAALLLLLQPAPVVQPVDCDTTRDAEELRACALAQAAAEAAVDSQLGLDDPSVPMSAELARQRARATVREAVRLFCADPRGDDHVARCAELDLETATTDLAEQWDQTLARMAAARDDDAAERIEALIEDQAAWTELLEAQCRSSKRSAVRQNKCRARLTRARTGHLRELASSVR